MLLLINFFGKKRASGKIFSLIWHYQDRFLERKSRIKKECWLILGKVVSPETREKLRITSSGKYPSEETRKKMSMSSRMKRPEECRKHSDAMKISMIGNKNGTGGRAASGMIKINDGKTEKFITKEDPVPPNWKRGRLKRKWITNGLLDKWILKSDDILSGWYAGRSTARGGLSKVKY